MSTLQAPLCSLARVSPVISRVRPVISSSAIFQTYRPVRRIHILSSPPQLSSPWHLRSRRPSMPSLSTHLRRSIFIQTESTPNADALKFLPNHAVLPPNLSTPFLEYLSPRATLAPPYPSPLAAQLLAVDGITSVFYGPDFITVTKAPDVNWAHVKPEVFSLITEAVTGGQAIVNVVEAGAPVPGQSATGQAGGEAADSLAYNEADGEVVGMIKELLETRIRPQIQQDGGDIEYRGFVDGMVLLKLRGACRTCDSSTVTLKQGIEGMMMHYIEEVRGVTQVLDEEEEIANKEFARFEEKLRQQKGLDAVTSTMG